jgi:hypothetical protein
MFATSSYFHCYFIQVLQIREKARSQGVFGDRVCTQRKHAGSI